LKEEVSFLTVYGQLYNRVSGADTGSFLKKWLTECLGVEIPPAGYNHRTEAASLMVSE
jgi:hypothetical protein